MLSPAPCSGLALTIREGRGKVFCDLQSSYPCLKHHAHSLGLLPCSGTMPVLWRGNTSLVPVPRRSPGGKEHLLSMFLRTMPVVGSRGDVAGNSCAHGGSLYKMHQGGTYAAFRTSPPVCCCCPWREGMRSRRLMTSLQSTNRFLLRLHGSPGWDTISC